MKHYTDTIPLDLAEKLKEKGMPMKVWNGLRQGLPYISVMEKSSFDWLDKELGNTPSDVEVRYSIPTFGACFDWLMEKGYRIAIHTKPANKPIIWFAYIGTMNPDYCIVADTRDCFSWHEAATKAIEKALEIIKED